MNHRETSKVVSVSHLTSVCSDPEQTREFYDENPGREFAEPPEVN